jgi:hypothetical protein
MVTKTPSKPWVYQSQPTQKFQPAILASEINEINLKHLEILWHTINAHQEMPAYQQGPQHLYWQISRKASYKWT